MDNSIDIEDRKYIWSFCGFIQKNNRSFFIEHLKKIQPYYLFETTATCFFNLNNIEYSNIMKDTMFIPCLPGNTNIETQRLIESLEFGCIPIVSKFYKFPFRKLRYWKYDYHNFIYYDELFEKISLPYVDNSYLSHFVLSGYSINKNYIKIFPFLFIFIFVYFKNLFFFMIFFLFLSLDYDYDKIYKLKIEELKNNNNIKIIQSEIKQWYSEYKSNLKKEILHILTSKF